MEIQHLNLGIIEELKKPIGEYWYKTVTEFDCIFKYKNQTYRITIPPGFVCDGNSGGPDVGFSWLFHDWLYHTHEFQNNVSCTREEADLLMYTILKYNRMNYSATLFKWLSHMNPFYKFSNAWNNSFGGCRFVR